MRAYPIQGSSSGDYIKAFDYNSSFSANPNFPFVHPSREVAGMPNSVILSLRQSTPNVPTFPIANGPFAAYQPQVAASSFPAAETYNPIPVLYAPRSFAMYQPTFAYSPWSIMRPAPGPYSTYESSPILENAMKKLSAAANTATGRPKRFIAQDVEQAPSPNNSSPSTEQNQGFERVPKLGECGNFAPALSYNIMPSGCASGISEEEAGKDERPAKNPIKRRRRRRGGYAKKPKKKCKVNQPAYRYRNVYKSVIRHLYVYVQGNGSNLAKSLAQRGYGEETIAACFATIKSFKPEGLPKEIENGAKMRVEEILKAKSVFVYILKETLEHMISKLKTEEYGQLHRTNSEMYVEACTEFLARAESVINEA